MPDKSEVGRGLFGKYLVQRIRTRAILWGHGHDGGRVPTEPYIAETVEECFVLRYDRDPHARVALLAYAASCEGENPSLAADLRALVTA